MATDYFLKIDGIEGESTDDQHRGEIEVDAWSFGGAQSSTFQGGGPRGIGKFDAQDLQFTAKLSKASPALFLACATGKRVPKATMTGRKGGNKPVDYLTITLTDVLISSYQESGASGSGVVPMEQVSCSFLTIQVEYRPMKADGSLGSPVKAGFDLKTNMPI